MIVFPNKKILFCIQQKKGKTFLEQHEGENMNFHFLVPFKEL